MRGFLKHFWRKQVQLLTSTGVTDIDTNWINNTLKGKKLSIYMYFVKQFPMLQDLSESIHQCKNSSSEAHIENRYNTSMMSNNIIYRCSRKLRTVLSQLRERSSTVMII